MLKILGFIGNFSVCMIFALDIFDYYFKTGINIISNDVNRPFIMWLGLVVSLLSAMNFIHRYTNNR